MAPQPRQLVRLALVLVGRRAHPRHRGDARVPGPEPVGAEPEAAGAVAAAGGAQRRPGRPAGPNSWKGAPGPGGRPPPPRPGPARCPPVKAGFLMPPPRAGQGQFPLGFFAPFPPVSTSTWEEEAGVRPSGTVFLAYREGPSRGQCRTHEESSFPPDLQ